MKPRINVITLAVADLAKSLAFYRDGLGLPSRGILGTEYHDPRTGASGTVAFFDLSGGQVLALYERTNLARDSGLHAGVPGPVELSLGYFVESRQAVDALLQQASILPTNGPGESIPGTSRTLTVTSGRSSGTPRRKLTTDPAFPRGFAEVPAW